MYDPILTLFADFDEKMREGYYGDHVDVYRPHVKYGWIYDKNPLFSYVMQKYWYPIRRINVIQSRDFQEGVFFGFAWVKVKTPLDLKIPFLPVKKDGKLIFPVGEWTGLYFSEEIWYAKSLGYGVLWTPIKGFSCDRGKPFTEFVKNIYKLRKSSDNPSHQLFYKWVLNGNQGKWG